MLISNHHSDVSIEKWIAKLNDLICWLRKQDKIINTYRIEVLHLRWSELDLVPQSISLLRHDPNVGGVDPRQCRAQES
jgi:hypothetical protein